MYSVDDIIKMLEFLVDNIFVFFFRKSLPANNRHSNGYKLCPSSRRHLSVFIRSGFRTVFALNGKETLSISVQSHLQVHRWCIVHKQPRIRKLSGPDVSCWTWDQRHHREHNFCFLITSKLLTQGYRYHKLRKTFGKFFRSYSELLSKFGEISFQDYVSQGIAHPVFYGDLVYKLRRVKGEANFISSGSKIVKRLRRRQYDPAIIEKTIGLVLGPFTALYRSFLKRCTLTNKAVGTIWRALSKPPQRRQGPDPRPLWLLVGTPSVFGPELAYRLRVAQPTLMDVTRYFWYTFILLYMFVYYIFMTSPLWLAVGPQST